MNKLFHVDNNVDLWTYFKLNGNVKQEDHGPHRSPEKILERKI